jgi:hypothetical protein
MRQAVSLILEAVALLIILAWPASCWKRTTSGR